MKKDTIKIINKNNTKMIAHRGLSGLEKENTIASFIACGNRSYYGSECDIHKTKDGYFVVCHDENTKRVSGIDKSINNSTLNELLNIKLIDLFDNKPKNYYLIPLLEEYLDINIKYGLKCVIELKDDFSDEDILNIYNIVKEKEYLDNTIFISFLYTNLEKMRNLSNLVKLQYLVCEYNNEILNKCIKCNLSIDIEYHAVTKELVDEMHQHTLEVNAWTVNDISEANRLIDFNVDYLTTNILE